MISTMNTRTGNAQSRGVSQIELEEDAMLTAIGQSSLDEMADKYADRWEDFIASLSRWRSIHQLLRLGQLNKALQKLTKREEELKPLIRQQEENIKLCKTLTKTAANAMLAVEAYKANPQTYTPSKSGRKPYNTKTAEVVAGQTLIAVSKYEKKAVLLREIEGKIWKWFVKPISEWQEDLEWAEDNLEDANIKKSEGQKELDKTRAELQKTKDQYDITKPYAMGLLVADIFYTLASALQGEIYL